jgi:hypothetical protein
LARNRQNYSQNFLFLLKPQGIDELLKDIFGLPGTQSFGRVGGERKYKQFLSYFNVILFIVHWI